MKTRRNNVEKCVRAQHTHTQNAKLIAFEIQNCLFSRAIF